MAPRETENNAYAKFWGDKQRTLWYVMVFLEWSIKQPPVNHRRGRFDPEKNPWSENADLKFNASNVKGDGSNKQGEERKSLNEFRMLKYFYDQIEAILDN